MISLLNKCTYFYAGFRSCVLVETQDQSGKRHLQHVEGRGFEPPIDWVIWIRFYNIQYRPIGLDRYQHLRDFRDS